jgi:hypothetical protein
MWGRLKGIGCEADMKTFARATGIVLLVAGTAIVLAGAFFIARGVVRPEPLAPLIFGGAGAEGILAPLRLLAGGLLAIQGLVLAAVGEGLYLLAGIAANTERAG